ncbi:MAG: type I secretion system permease/ATPase [Rhizobiales bacterium 24-66-13]|nr:MAG: type I secretion system permease/ATPase [Rhizobiales bacterium 24-66-13]OZB03050.1 MAG: type I secretion system permease/ATPase [Rhizobiales bacterium 39-66-18]HQS10622.1 type I secretion system permease/ATPase [Xanthobacteraceae bacterium]HQS48343.1 type I secretion system permease/ATPase [Xanthobacteraceae bacterium]
MSTRDRRAGHRIRGTDLDEAMAQCRKAAWVLLAFSLAINLLMLASPLYMLQVYDRVMVTGSVNTLVMLTILAAAALLLLGVLDGLRAAVTIRMSSWLSDRLGPVYLSHSVRTRLMGDGSGAQAMRDLSQVQAFIASPGLSVFFDAPWAPVFLVLIWILHPALGLLAVCSAGLLLALGIANETLTRASIAAASQAQIAATLQAETTIRNAEVVRAMGMLPALIERWRVSNDVGVRASQEANERSALLLGFTKFARLFMQSATLGLGAYLVLKGEVSGGAMIAASILLGRALAPVEMAMGTWRNFGLARVAYYRLQMRLQSMPDQRRRFRLPSPAGFISLDQVSYTPPGMRAPVLQQVSFQARPGEAIAVIGPSASGKSTLCRLLVGVARPTSGEVRLDGSDLGHWNPDDLGRHLGYLPQDAELFPGTIRDNISRMSGGADDAAVIEAAMLAHAHDMIQRLPNGYDTAIGDGALRLSGGQRQRIGLARAIYGVPRLIVLDEPNANLDQAGEAALSAALEEMKRKGATLLIVGHRPSTIAQADKILLMKDGRVEGFGPRDEILKRLRLAVSGASPMERNTLRDGRPPVPAS